MKHFPTILLGLFIGTLIGSIISLYLEIKHQDKIIASYKQYYQGTESLLDELDSAYNWVDGYDRYEYYSSKTKIDSLTHKHK